MGKTETIENQTQPDFAVSFNLDFVFETRQIYRVKIIKKGSESVLGEGQFELADIVGSLENMKIIRLIK